mmetsp:Transcript_18054/g.25717  ORF Transcript_18054/g.25717 Transcript_18054/m.25717 type:complete len:81 (-) Transcript_18054:92-334(-)
MIRDIFQFFLVFHHGAKPIEIFFVSLLQVKKNDFGFCQLEAFVFSVIKKACYRFSKSKEDVELNSVDGQINNYGAYYVDH